MSVIYTGITAGSAATQARPADYFAGFKESLTQMQADKDKKNQDKLDSLAEIPNLSTTNMWDSHFQVAQEMDENLRDTLEEASESPESMAAWERRLQQRMDFVAESEAYYKNTAANLIQRAEMAGDPTLNPKELRDAGKIDGNTREHYEAEMARLDDIGQFSGVTVSGDSFVLPNNTPLLGIFDDQVELLKPNLVDMDFQRPEGWWSSHVGGKETDVTDLEAKNYIIGIIEDDEVEKQAAVNWYVETSGADRDKVDKNVAIDAYAEAAAKGRVKAKGGDDKKKTTKSVIENGNISSASSAEMVADTEGNQAIFPTAKSTFTFDNSDMPRARYGDAEKLRRLVSISFDGQDYTALFEDGEQVNINFNPMEGEVSYFDEISGQIDANMPGGESLREIIERLYEAQQKELEDQ